MTMAEMESNSPKRDTKKDYEAIEMLKTENDEDCTEEKRMSKKDSKKQVTVRRVFH